MVYKGQWDSNHTSYPYIGEHQGKYFVASFYSDANGGGDCEPMYEDSNGVAITGDYVGDVNFRHNLYDTVSLAMQSQPDQNWVKV